MRMFNALATKEEDAVIPARRYLSTPRFALDLVRTALRFASLKRLLHDANPRGVEVFGESKSDTIPRDIPVNCLQEAGLAS
jgi:hypothetical protein